MKELLKELRISLSDIQTKEELSAKFKSIADKLFEKYEVRCGKKHFRFAEIEFYYYRKGCFDEEWNCVTYDRKNKEDGDLMYHYSGVDICFKSNYSDKEAEFGGILIRSLYTLNEKGERNLVFGPWACKDEMLNNCEGEMPKLCKSEKTLKCDVKSTSLAGVPKEKQSNHCFYDSSIAIEEWTRNVERYDVKKQKVWIYRPKYNVERFDLKKQINALLYKHDR